MNAILVYNKDWMNFVQNFNNWQQETRLQHQATMQFIQDQSHLVIDTLTKQIQNKNHVIDNLQAQMQKVVRDKDTQL